MAKQAKWRIGIIGAGGISEAHLEAIEGEERAEVAAIADVSLEIAQKRAAQFNIPQVFSDYEAMLEESHLDAVIVCVPNCFHEKVTRKALAAGKHVLCEKPLAINARQAEDMIAAAKQEDKILMVAQNNRFRSEVQYVKQMLDDGKLGDVYHAKAGWVRRHGIPGWGSWFTQKEQAGGGPLIDIGVHMLDVALWLVGHPKPLTVLGQTYAKFGPQKRGLSEWGRIEEKGRFDVEDMAVAMITFENGFTLTLDASWASHIQEENAFLAVYGNEGGTSLQLMEDRLTYYHDLKGAPATTEIVLKHRRERVQLFRNFIDSLEGKSAPLCTPEQALYINRIIDAIYLSAQTGEAVRL